MCSYLMCVFVCLRVYVHVCMCAQLCVCVCVHVDYKCSYVRPSMSQVISVLNTVQVSTIASYSQSTFTIQHLSSHNCAADDVYRSLQVLINTNVVYTHSGYVTSILYVQLIVGNCIIFSTFQCFLGLLMVFRIFCFSRRQLSSYISCNYNQLLHNICYFFEVYSIFYLQQLTIILIQHYSMYSSGAHCLYAHSTPLDVQLYF